MHAPNSPSASPVLRFASFCPPLLLKSRYDQQMLDSSGDLFGIGRCSRNDACSQLTLLAMLPQDLKLTQLHKGEPSSLSNILTTFSQMIDCNSNKTIQGLSVTFCHGCHISGRLTFSSPCADGMAAVGGRSHQKDERLGLGRLGSSGEGEDEG